MKKIIPILLIVAFFLQSTSQFWILASFYINRDYIEANICINRFDTMPVCKGSCYLEKQLNENDKKQEKLPDIKTKEINLFCQNLSIDLPKQIHGRSLKISYANCNYSAFTSNYLSSVFRPPSRIV